MAPSEPNVSSRPVHRFVVTLRWESGGVRVCESEWRGDIVNVMADDVVYFRGVDGLGPAWQRMTRDIRPPSERNSRGDETA